MKLSSHFCQMTCDIVSFSSLMGLSGSFFSQEQGLQGLFFGAWAMIEGAHSLARWPTEMTIIEYQDNEELVLEYKEPEMQFLS